MSGFKPKHGMRCVTRDGRVTDGIVVDIRSIGAKEDEEPLFTSIDGYIHTFRENGRNYPEEESGADLVAEYVEPPPPRYVPFGPDDMPSLLGRHIRGKSWKHGQIATIDYVADDRVIFNAGMDRAMVFSSELLADYEFVDIATMKATPCGKLVQP